MTRNDRISLLREQSGRSFADAVQGLVGKNFRRARAASYDVNSLVLYILVAKIVGNLRVRGEHVAYP
jgi:hypothetical protein